MESNYLVWARREFGHDPDVHAVMFANNVLRECGINTYNCSNKCIQ